MLPCAGATSGNTNYKYALNTSLGAGTPVTVLASANPLTISKVSDKSVYLFNSTAIFTVTVQNPGAYGVSIDKITDELPSGFTYQSLDASSQVTATNSTTNPATGALGTLTFEGGVTSSGNTSYYIPAGGSIILKYTATAPSSPASNQVTNARDYVGIKLVGAAQNTVSVAATLPVSLVSFHAGNVNDGIQLKWTTSNEVNSKWFELERSNGNNAYIHLSTIAASENSVGNNNYSFIDSFPGSGINNYRLKTLDQDLEYKYSQVVSIRSSDHGYRAAGIYPNPFVNNTTIHLSLENNIPIHVALYDNIGNLVFLKDIAGRKGNNTYILDRLAVLPKGNYIMHISTLQGNKHFKVVKLR